MVLGLGEQRSFRLSDRTLRIPFNALSRAIIQHLREISSNFIIIKVYFVQKKLNLNILIILNKLVTFYKLFRNQYIHVLA